MLWVSEFVAKSYNFTAKLAIETGNADLPGIQAMLKYSENFLKTAPVISQALIYASAPEGQKVGLIVDDLINRQIKTV